VPILGQQTEGYGYPAVNQCIYCGSTTRRLTKEHIIGRGIGGTVTLDKASCSAALGVKSAKHCSEITRDIEQFCFRSMLGHFRHYIDLPVSQPRSKLPLTIIHSDGVMEVKDVDINDHIGMMSVPIFDKPGLLTGRLYEALVDTWTFIPNKEPFSGYPEKTRLGRNKFHARTYAKMLAKIAHSFAVAQFGIDAFEEMFLPSLILDKKDQVPCDRYVGCLERNPAPETSLHNVGLGQAKLDTGQEFIMAKVRLFCMIGAPQYHVMVGRLKPSARNAIPLLEEQTLAYALK